MTVHDLQAINQMEEVRREQLIKSVAINQQDMGVLVGIMRSGGFRSHNHARIIVKAVIKLNKIIELKKRLINH